MRALALLAVLVLPLALAPVASASDPTVIAGSGRVSTYFIWGFSRMTDAGAHDATWACVSCVIQITVIQPGFTVVANGQATTLPAGEHQITGFSGVITAEQNARFDWTLQIEGVGMHE
ncbi:MAG TPA: hypothetical protein VHH36_02065 [Candidatus Thermoplasmatota archaeon]|nr:hypothetical protein [Candidatus Thermoplasmatota archaeon]